ncbi:MAG: sugar phosphate isomerase/epimerase [Dysgonamonadaceae bacterium]|jgi:sugar phosphate isomerase/epimerase|nr:sugar phosphate isomerase/epimerase [Dysgonamonadaceae bacterium]
MNRRDFLHKGMAAAAACCALGMEVNAAEAAKRNKSKIGVQLYTINKSLPGDNAGCLRKLSDMGYGHAEAYGFNGEKFLDKPLSEWKKMLEDVGMTLSGSHCGTPLLPQDTGTKEWDYWRKSATEMKSAGGKYLVQSFLPARKSLDEIKRVAEQFNKIGEICKRMNIKFGYHNHNEEFKEVEGQIILDTIIRNTDPNLVFFQMDFGHVINAGGDIISYMEKYPKRFLSWHASDFKRGQGYVELGKGDVPYKTLFENAQKFGLKDLTMEHETGDDIYASCRNNFEYLSQFKWTR